LPALNDALLLEYIDFASTVVLAISILTKPLSTHETGWVGKRKSRFWNSKRPWRNTLKNDEELGNMDVKGGETTIVECDSDEAIAIAIAIAIALAYDVPLKVDSAIVDSASIMVQPQESRPLSLITYLKPHQWIL
jgi:hypothetical protein